jgi:hypothetical protein
MTTPPPFTLQAVLVFILPLAFSCSMASGKFEQAHNSQRDVIQSVRTYGTTEALNDYVVDIQVANQRINGRAWGGTVLFFWRTGVGDHTSLVMTKDGEVLKSDDQKHYSDVSRLDEIKSAAVRAACDAAHCDILAYPLYNVNEHNWLFGTTYEVEVIGFPAKLEGMQNVRRNIRGGTIDFGNYGKGQGAVPTNEEVVPEGNRYLIKTGAPIELVMPR